MWQTRGECVIQADEKLPGMYIIALILQPTCTKIIEDLNLYIIQCNIRKSWFALNYLNKGYSSHAVGSQSGMARQASSSSKS